MPHISHSSPPLFPHPRFELMASVLGDAGAHKTVPEAGPTELNTSVQGHGLEVGVGKLTVHYRGEGRHGADVGAIQANRPAPLLDGLYYFEMTVIEAGEAGRIAIGFTPSAFKLTKQPG